MLAISSAAFTFRSETSDPEPKSFPNLGTRSIKAGSAATINGLMIGGVYALIAVGLTLIFGVMKIVNFAHGSFYMLGIYIAYSLVERLTGAFGFWVALPLAAVSVGVIGALVEIILLRRIYKAPELFQLLATFALVLVIRDAVLWLWGPEELLGPRAPGLTGEGKTDGKR